ncbi:MAG: hypothetical protein IJD65_03000, partial [Mailhella sp.]|nr:hypothetical protein [Mailhella sp.]
LLHLLLEAAQSDVEIIVVFVEKNTGHSLSPPFSESFLPSRSAARVARNVTEKAFLRKQAFRASPERGLTAFQHRKMAN